MIIYYANDPFFQDIVLEEGVRMASVEEVIAMKVDVVQRGGRKKVFWDLHELLLQYPIGSDLNGHTTRL